MTAPTYPPRFAGEPWAVDEDLTFDEIDARRRNDSKRLCFDLRDSMTTYDKLRDEAAHLLAYRITDGARIAEHLGLSESEYEYAIGQHLPPVLTTGDQAWVDGFERLIAEGRPFSVTGLPTPDNEGIIRSYPIRARNAGRIRKIGVADKRVNVTLWQSAAAVDAELEEAAHAA